MLDDALALWVLPNSELAQGWIAAEQKPESEPRTEEDERFVMALTALEFMRPDRAIQIVLEIARSSADEDVLCALGCGPLEGLLARHPHFFHAIEEECQASPGLVIALDSVWQNAMSDELYAQVRSLAGNPSVN